MRRGGGVAEVDEQLAAARQAFAGGDWEAARAGLLTEAASGRLEATDLDALGQSCWWLGHMDECQRYLEEAHRAYLDIDERVGAAMTAMSLAVDHFLRGDDPIGSGWMRRAVRIADELPEGPIHGYLAYVLDVEAHLGGAEASGVIAAARRVQDIGRRHGDPTLVAAGMTGEGRMLLSTGQVDEGLALLDEAMIAVVAGEVAPEWAGNLYCNTIAACHQLGDLSRMARWTEATEAWLDTLPAAALFAGICRVHRAQLRNLSGDWDRAEREAVQVCEDLAGISVVNVAEAWYEVGEVRRRRGDLRGSEEAYQRAHACGRDPQPGLALLRLAQGRTEVALSSIQAALHAAGTDRLGRAQLCAARVEIALAAHEPDLARSAAADLEEIAAMCGSRVLAAMAGVARGAILIAEGRPESALTTLREAARTWRELGVPYEAARTGVHLARAYGRLADDEAAARELDAAAAAFDRLGAAVDAAEAASLRGSGEHPGGLSEREVEVLGLVAEGRSNAQIAEALFISRKTVARHLSNIFVKLDVSSRTEAARFAFDHGLLPTRAD